MEKKKKLILVLIIAVAVLAAAACVYFTAFSPEAKLARKYDAATERFNNGDYVGALPLYEEILPYMDSADSVVLCKYHLGEEAMVASDWEAAAAYFTGLEYKDSEELLSECKYRLGEAAMAAFDWGAAAAYFDGIEYGPSRNMLNECLFMIDLEKSIGQTLTEDSNIIDLEGCLMQWAEISKEEFDDYLFFVQEEENKFLKYYNLDFHDPAKKELFEQYLYGLGDQHHSYRIAHLQEPREDMWQKGLLQRYYVLNTLYKAYGFMAENEDFVARYISTYDDQQAIYEATLAITEDIRQQYDFSTWEGDYYILNLTNNTEYTFSATWKFTYVDRTGAFLKSIPITVSDIEPGQQYEVKVYNDEPFEFVAYNYYIELK